MRSGYGQRLQIVGIPNAGKINDGFYRGAQPRESGLPALKKLGITTIVDLRGEDRDRVEQERKQAESLYRGLAVRPGFKRNVFLWVPRILASGHDFVRPGFSGAAHVRACSCQLQGRASGWN